MSPIRAIRLFGQTVAICLAAVAWSGPAEAGPPEGFEVVDIVDDLDWTQSPQINNCGQAVLAINPQGEGDGEVFVYDNGVLIRITDDEVHDTSSDINDDGVVVWARVSNPPQNPEVMFYSQGVATVIGQGYPGAVSISRHVLWERKTFQGCQNLDREIDFFDGKTVTQLTEGGRNNQGSEINDTDEIVWTAYNDCNVPWTSDIMWYCGGKTVRMPTQQLQPQIPTINNPGLVAWGEAAGIEMWDGLQITLLTDWGRNPRLNNLGDMYFLRWHDESETWQGWLYLHTGEFLQLTDDPFWNADGDINDAGEVVWRWYNRAMGEMGYRLMQRIRTGDGDLDGDIDLDDYAMFLDCVTGPEWVELTNPGPEDSLCECRFLDIDHDGDVDFHDFAIFQRNFEGNGQ